MPGEGGADGNAVLLVVRAMVGPTLLGVGVCIVECGLLFGTLLIALSGAMAWHTGRLLLAAADALEIENYDEIAKATLGAKGSGFVGFAVVALGIGQATAIIKVCKEVLSDLPEIDPLCMSLPWPCSSPRVLAGLATGEIARA